MPRFSLIMCSVDRVDEPKRLLTSLQAQTFDDFELVVVDQNDGDQLKQVCALFPSMRILQVQSARGLSRARNVGIKSATGEIIAFPDDDCWYHDDVLSRVNQLLESQPDLDGAAGRTMNERGRDSLGRFPSSPMIFRRENILRHHNSNTLFFRRRVVDAVGWFDEELGVGAGTRWGAGEETDYLCRALDKGFRFLYTPDVVVRHPTPVRHFDQMANRRARAYGTGTGFVMRRHGYSVFTLASIVLRPAAVATYYLLTARPSAASFYFTVAISRLRGWLHA